MKQFTRILLGLLIAVLLSIMAIHSALNTIRIEQVEEQLKLQNQAIDVLERMVYDDK